MVKLLKRHGDRKMLGREINLCVSSAALFWSLKWRQSEQGELGGKEMARPQGSHSALQVLSGECFGGCVCMCVCVFVYLCVCAQEGTELERKERHRQAQRTARMGVSRWEQARELWFRGRVRRKLCSFLQGPGFRQEMVRNAQPAH